jgi:hypothetical protein
VACGTEDKRDSATTPEGSAAATAAPTTTPADDPVAELPASDVKAVRAALAACLADADPGGVVVQYRDGELTAPKSAKIERTLGAEEATAKAVDAGAQYVGLRDDASTTKRTPDLDIIVFGVVLLRLGPGRRADRPIHSRAAHRGREP